MGAATALGGAAASATTQVAWFIPMLVAAIAFFQYEIMDPESRVVDVEMDDMLTEYDFIVIGAGSAGMYY